jgi:hypothetical protein
MQGDKGRSSGIERGSESNLDEDTERSRVSGRDLDH